MNENFRGILHDRYKDGVVSVSASGSYYVYSQAKMSDVESKPENCVDPNAELEWCSNYDHKKEMKPWLLLTFNKSKVKLDGYSLGSGCCVYSTCCCKMYTWQLQGSNDNETWDILHNDKNNNEFGFCLNKEFKIESNKWYKMIKLIQLDAENNCPTCISLRKIELFGEIESDEAWQNVEDADENEVSIIGKVKKSSE